MYKQKEFIQLYTKKFEPSERDNLYSFMGVSWAVPELLYISFMLVNDHIERDNCKWEEARFNFEKLGLN